MSTLPAFARSDSELSTVSPLAVELLFRRDFARTSHYQSSCLWFQGFAACRVVPFSCPCLCIRLSSVGIITHRGVIFLIFFCYPSIGCILCFLSLRAVCPPLESRIAQGTVHNALGYSIIYQQASACISYWQTESTYRAYVPSTVLSCSSLPCFLLPHECICLSFYSLYVIFIDLI